ncbi:bacterial Ig-like domain-containing protein [Enterococcus casseliflavus]|uniref:bacterial Ig-like domain-containing protein n=1 Tax=Enterococcus casseliflavus TaxID=37734 RepID=UPI0018842CA1|nr:bacterial Ig-like domain-containing protein [Enterococcus casseliflavus]MBE9909056.1 LPXTG cell wall anchor domain-containing protein [Enterococcus casseliflavus]
MKNKHMHLFLVGLLFGSIVMNPVQALTDTLGIAPAQEQEAANLLSEPLNSFEKSENQEPSPDNKDVFSESEAKENLLENETSSSLEDAAAMNEEQSDNRKELSESQSSESDTRESMTDNADQNQIHKKDSKTIMTPMEASETFTYDLTVEYDPIKFKPLVIDLPIPEKYIQDELYFRLMLGGDDGNFYEYKSDQQYFMTGLSHSNPVIGVNTLQMSWSNFTQGWSPDDVEYFGFTVVIPYKDANGNDLFAAAYNIRFTNSHLTINYVDESGNEIYPSRRIDDSTNQPYDVSTSDYIPEIPGYELDTSNLPVDAIGKFKRGEFTVTYVYQKAQIDYTDILIKDSTIHTQDTWSPIDNFIEASSKEGKQLTYEEFLANGGIVSGTVDTQTAGTYTVRYTLNNLTKDATIVVKPRLTAINVSDSTIYVGDSWEAEDNFDSALDKDGNDVDFSALTVDASKADTSKSGSFEVTYTYDGVTSTAIVTVKEKMTAVNVHDSTIYVGDNWEAEDNFDNALDKDGNDVALSDLTVDASKADTSKAGTFEVTYTYDGVTSTAIVTVKEKMTAVNVHDSTIYVGDNWEAKDNFDSALDKDGNDVDFSALTVDASKADTSKAGSFKVTYTYDGVTSTVVVTVIEKQTAVNVHDSTIYVGDSWEAEDNFDSALDKDGNDVDFSALTVDASKADTSEAGSFDVTYMYDGVTSTAIVTVKEKMTAVNVHDSTIYVGDNWEAEDNFDSALDKDGNDVALSDLTVDASKADTSKSGSFDVTYTYDGVTSTATITVKEKMTAVNVHDSTIYVGDNWEAEDNFDSALDKDDNPVDFQDLAVDASKADTSKAGSFKVTYTYDGVTSIAIVTVKEKMTAVNVHDSTIYVGDNWEAEDNFDSALDKSGNDVALSDLTVDVSKADTSKAGSFDVTYTYDGVTSTATITVKEKMTAVNVHDSTIYVGDNWQAEDNFDSALDKDGNDVDFSAITVDASKAETNKVGSFEVTYTYDGVTSTATITVKEKMTAVNVHDSTLYVGDNWQADDNFDSALDKDGNSVDFQDLTIDASQADTSKAGSFEVTYTYDGVTSTAVVTVKEKQTAVNVHDSTIYVGDSWEAEDNFDSALDKDGTDVALSDLTIDASEADTSKAGSFEITYTYDGVTSIAIITVKEKMTAVNVHDSTLYVGDNWEAEDNFDGALDKDGNDVALSDLTVDASQSDTSKSGSFKVTYTYDGITSTATITVKEKMTAVNVHDSTIYVGDNWEVEGNFDGALDKDGNSVDFQDLTVDASKADTSKAGSFEVTYTYDGVTSTATVTVKEKQTAVNVHDSTIYVGDSWEAEDNFDSALDKDGNDVAFSALTVDASKADTSKAGSFEVAYTYDGVTSKAIITVKEKMTAVNVHDSTLYVGDKWTAKENFDNAFDKAGKKVVYEDLTVDASQVDTSKAGSYEVSYSYDGITVTATVTVKEKPSQEKPADDSTHTTPEQKKENQKKTTSDSKKQVTLPKTNENKSVVELVAGVIIVLLTGVIFFWKKRNTNKV